MTVHHRLYTEKMNTKSILDELIAQKFTRGPAPSNEFKIKEGEKIKVFPDKNILFSSEEKFRMLTFHSNFNSASMQTKLTQKDEFAQHAYDEYHGNIISSRADVISTGEGQIQMADTGDVLCKLPVQIPKMVRFSHYCLIRAQYNYLMRAICILHY